NRRLWAVFEPRSNTSRRKIFEAEFAQALAAADRVVVAGLYQPERIPENDRLAPEAVVKEINRISGDHRAVAAMNTDEIADRVGNQSKAGDVILVMSNGGFDQVQEKILRVLRNRKSL
ncbi:MAG: UDP-N-acetylmuramate:L-alanyl-gamma-D-glutamyl-meso-diaminopimelate ligase, partial [Deltaproteobacteria bacterium]|nr:UDP-N-acetylmuramate:L-alanyl-gamma-D-glutamyl-meso-diaminopimelate ligase [Deltaproteobacteria bacterium]